MSKWIDRTFGIALGTSLVLHAGGVGGPAIYQWITGQNVSGFFFMPPPEPVKKLPVEFVDSPDSADDTAKLERETNRIAASETVARDLKETPAAPVAGPAADLVKKSQQLAKKNHPDLMKNLRQGTPEKPEEFMTAEDPLKKPSPPEKTPSEIESKVKELEEMKMLLEKMEKAKQLDEKEKNEILKQEVKKKLQELKEKKQPQGNAPQTVQEKIFNPVRNLDTYSSEEIQKFLASAVNVGESSYDAKKHLLGAYLKKLKSRISPLWRLKLESQSWGTVYDEKKVVIGFTIRADGSLAQILIVEDYGDDLFNQLCIEAIQASAPFDPLPPEWIEQSGQDYLNLIHSFAIVR